MKKILSLIIHVRHQTDKGFEIHKNVIPLSTENGFECLVVQDACATRDLKFGDRVIKAADVHASTLATLQGGGYGKVTDCNDFKDNADRYLLIKGPF